MNVVARWPGSTHDATIFNNSVLRAQCDAGLFGNRWMLGDSAYPNRSHLLKPVLNPVNEAEKRYNEAHIRTRNTIERTFGVWKRRFPVVTLTLRLSLTKAQAVIIATAVLHNICRNYNLQEFSSEVDLPPEDTNFIDLNSEVTDVQQRAVLISGPCQCRSMQCNACSIGSLLDLDGINSIPPSPLETSAIGSSLLPIHSPLSIEMSTSSNINNREIKEYKGKGRYTMPTADVFADPVSVCKVMFLNTLGIGAGMVTIALKKVEDGNGVITPDGRGGANNQ
ncbi:unnamed protein product [Colias eurytheme]|nr:unnamed protein product [Colias eurytheme]